VAGGGVLVGNEAGAVLRLDAEGRVVWRVALQREVAVAPVVAAADGADPVVVAGTVKGEWAGVALRDGQVRWRQVDAPPLTVPPVVQGPRVYALSPEGAVRALHAPTGGTLWALLPPPALRRTPPPRPLPAPVLCGDTLAAALGAAGVVGLSPEDGERRWALPLADVAGLACADGGRVLVAREGGVLVAVDGADGREAWRRELGGALAGPPRVEGGQAWAVVGPRGGTEGPWRLVGVPLATGGGGAAQVRELPVAPGPLPALGPGLAVVASAGREGLLAGVRLADGATLFSTRLDSRLPTAPLLHGGLLWVAALDGRVLAFRLQGDAAAAAATASIPASRPPDAGPSPTP
jgi:hypothetical protein